jgi:hypothetical protein
MTHNDLDRWRKYVPFALFSFSILLWLVITSRSLAETKLATEVIVPILAIIAAFFYVGFNVRGLLWRSEIDEHVGKQIRAFILDMVPKDLEITEAEKQDLEREIFKNLTGVFWEAVDRNDLLRSLKEHFYSNGVVYSTSIDVHLILGFVGVVYALGCFVTPQPALAFAAIVFLLLSIVSRVFVTPRTRARQLTLSAEQLELLRREEANFVTNRLRDMVNESRRRRLLPP